MKKYIIAMLLTMSYGCFCALLHAQDLSVSVTSPDDETVVPEAGIQLTADATPANGADGECVTFDWTDPDGDWGTGTVTGLESNLMYYPEGDIYGTAPVINCTVTDGVGDTDFDTVNLVVPLIDSVSIDELSYYDGATWTPNAPNNTGMEQTSLRVKIVPDPSDSGAVYTVNGAGGAITATQESDQQYIQVASTDYSRSGGDQDVQLLDSNGNLAADLTLTVNYPLNATDVFPYQYVGQTNGLGYKAWTITYTYAISYYLGPFADDGTPMNEEFNTASGSWASAINGSARGLDAVRSDDYGPGCFIDNYIANPILGLLSLNPLPVWNTDSGAGTATGSVTQWYYAGGHTNGYVPGVGTVVLSHTVSWYRGYANR